LELAQEAKAPRSFSITWTTKKQLWYLDSDCSKHMTGDASKFMNLKMKQA